MQIKHLKSDLKAPIPTANEDKSNTTNSNTQNNVSDNKACGVDDEYGFYEDDPFKEFDEQFLKGKSVNTEKDDSKESFRERINKDHEAYEEKKLHPINFDGIIGHEDLKKEILRAVLSKLKNNPDSDAYRKATGNRATKNILMYGLPGVGKSEILYILLNSLKDHQDIDCRHIDCSEFQGTTGSNAEKINAVFESARNSTKRVCVIVIDEIDSVMLKKGKFLNATERTNAMQSNLDGIKDSSKIIVVASTNRVNNMESASLSRFKRIDLELPNLEDRKQLIKKFICPLPIVPAFDDEKVNIMARDTEGFTGRNYRDIGETLDDERRITDKPIPLSVVITEQNKFRARAAKVSMHIEGDD